MSTKKTTKRKRVAGTEMVLLCFTVPATYHITHRFRATIGMDPRDFVAWSEDHEAWCWRGEPQKKEVYSEMIEDQRFREGLLQAVYGGAWKSARGGYFVRFVRQKMDAKALARETAIQREELQLAKAS